MPKKLLVNWKKFEKFLLFVGCTFEREKGDHRIYARNDLMRPIVFSHMNPLPLFVVRNNLRILGLSWAEFEEIWKKL